MPQQSNTEFNVRFYFHKLLQLHAMRKDFQKMLPKAKGKAIAEYEKHLEELRNFHDQFSKESSRLRQETKYLQGKKYDQFCVRQEEILMSKSAS